MCWSPRHHSPAIPQSLTKTDGTLLPEKSWLGNVGATLGEAHEHANPYGQEDCKTQLNKATQISKCLNMLTLMSIIMCETTCFSCWAVLKFPPYGPMEDLLDFGYQLSLGTVQLPSPEMEEGRREDPNTQHLGWQWLRRAIHFALSKLEIFPRVKKMEHIKTNWNQTDWLHNIKMVKK